MLAASQRRAERMRVLISIFLCVTPNDCENNEQIYVITYFDMTSTVLICCHFFKVNSQPYELRCSRHGIKIHKYKNHFMK